MEKAKLRLIGAGVALGLLAFMTAGAEKANRGAAPVTVALAAPTSPAAIPARSKVPAESPPRAVGLVRAPGDAAVLAGSLRGTDVDGTLQVLADGRFVANAEAVRLFDYLLSTEGEVPADAIRTRLADEAHRRLSPAEAARAIALFDRYVAYRRGGDVRTPKGTRGDYRGALEASHAARVAAFGEEDARRMFGQDEALARASIVEAEALTSDAGDDERARRVAAAEEGLPPEIRAMHERRAAEAAQVAALVAAANGANP
ncbi:MAG TPA: lipase secretion chaperone [Polyangiaceae bacterium]